MTRLSTNERNDMISETYNNSGTALKDSDIKTNTSLFNALANKPSSSDLISSNIRIGNEVVLNDSRVGHVRYIGEMDFMEGVWYGIELISPHSGSNDGEIGGKRYFKCADKQGVFVTKYNIKTHNIHEPIFDNKDNNKKRN
eukprot:UN34464